MKILVVRFSAAGDIVLTSLFLRSLRARFPDADIHVLTKSEFLPLVAASPRIDRAIGLESSMGIGGLLRLRRTLIAANNGPYDILFDLHNSLRSRLLRSRLFGRRIARAVAVFKKPTLAKWLLVHRKINRLAPIVPIPERYLAVGAPFGLENDGNGLELFIGDTAPPDTGNATGPLIALAPGARHATKQWPPEKFAELGSRLARELAARIVLVGGPQERELCNTIAAGIDAGAINLAGTTTLAQAAALFDLCTVVVANDSALAHVAAARHRPVVAIFGSTVREFGFAPYGAISRVVEMEGLECRPCTAIGREACPRGPFPCLRANQAERLLKPVTELEPGRAP